MKTITYPISRFRRWARVLAACGLQESPRLRPQASNRNRSYVECESLRCRRNSSLACHYGYLGIDRRHSSRRYHRIARPRLTSRVINERPNEPHPAPTRAEEEG